jgi:hypothetical protein
MTQKKAGAPPKFSVESVTMRISRVVPKEHHDFIKQQTNDFITKLQNDASDKCVAEVYKNRK